MDYTVKQLYRQTPKANLSGVKVSGWVRTVRESKSFAFIELNDGSFFKNLQIVLEEERLSGYKEILRRVGVGASIEAEGELILTPEMKQPFELKATSLTVVGESPSDYPLQKKAPHPGIPAHHRAPQAPGQPVPMRLPGALGGGPGHPPLHA